MKSIKLIWKEIRIDIKSTIISATCLISFVGGGLCFLSFVKSLQGFHFLPVLLAAGSSGMILHIDMGYQITVHSFSILLGHSTNTRLR